MAEADGNRTRRPALAGPLILKLRAARDAPWGFVFADAVWAGHRRPARPGCAGSCGPVVHRLVRDWSEIRAL